MKKLNLRIKLYLSVAICLTAVVLSACKKAVEFHNVILVTGTETTKIVKFTVETTPSSYGVTATATDKVPQDVNVTFAIDSNLVKTYNKETSASYVIPPKGSYELSATSGVIKAGTNISNAVTVRILSTANFVDGRSYIIPVTITNVTGTWNVLEASRTIYLKVARVTNFNSIDISNYNFYYPYSFTKSYDNVTQFTFEIKCLINAWHPGSNQISRLCNWGPVDQSLPNLLRFGEAGSLINQLQWVSAEGSVFSTTQFTTGVWYTISCVYNGTSYKMYVNGVYDSGFDGAGKVYQLGALEIGMSYAGYQSAQKFLGDVAEIRFWNRALSPTEIQEGICGVDAAASGLVGYWKMNEGAGNIFYDRTGNGRNMTWPVTPVWTGTAANKCAQ